MNIREALDRLGADENAPEGSQAWTLAEIGRQHEQTVEALCVAREALIQARLAGGLAQHAIPQVCGALEVRS